MFLFITPFNFVDEVYEQHYRQVHTPCLSPIASRIGLATWHFSLGGTPSAPYVKVESQWSLSTNGYAHGDKPNSSDLKPKSSPRSISRPDSGRALMNPRSTRPSVLQGVFAITTNVRTAGQEIVVPHQVERTIVFHFVRIMMLLSFEHSNCSS